VKLELTAEVRRPSDDYRLSPVDLDDVEDRLSTDGTRRISAVMQADGAVVTHAHVTTRVQDTVRSTLQAHSTLVGRVVLRFRL